MTDFDYQNWLEERDLLMEDILTLLREQQDLRGVSSFTGSFKINAREFNTGKHLIVGPIDIGTTFKKEPIVTFGQQGRPILSDERVTNVSSLYTPFLVQPYVYKWTLDSDGVTTGFYAGIYLISQPSQYTEDHVIYWHVTGEASRYIQELEQENWTEPYAEEDIDFLVENPENPEDSAY